MRKEENIFQFYLQQWRVDVKKKKIGKRKKKNFFYTIQWILWSALKFFRQLVSFSRHATKLVPIVRYDPFWRVAYHCVSSSHLRKCNSSPTEEIDVPFFTFIRMSERTISFPRRIFSTESVGLNFSIWPKKPIYTYIYLLYLYIPIYTYIYTYIRIFIYTFIYL